MTEALLGGYHSGMLSLLPAHPPFEPEEKTEKEKAPEFFEGSRKGGSV